MILEQRLLQSVNASFSWIRQQYHIPQPLELLLINPQITRTDSQKNIVTSISIIQQDEFSAFFLDMHKINIR